MATYHVENYREQKTTTIQADSVDAALLQAAKLFPTEGATGWLYTPKEGRDGKYDRWTQMAPTPVVLERTGLVVDCFKRYPDLEGFQPPNAK